MTLATRTPMKIRLTHISITHTEVAVPAECPHCGAVVAGVVPNPEDDGYNPLIGSIQGVEQVARLNEPNGNGPQDPELLGVEDTFDVGNEGDVLVAYLSCGNPECGRIILEADVARN